MSDTAQINDCWNSIGVQGDKTCPLLDGYIHCRNCHVYEAAAAALMNRPLPERYQQEWSQQFSLEQTSQDVKTHSAVVFRVANEWLALPTKLIVEVAELRSIHAIPHRRVGALAGLTNARGELLICISLSTLLNISDKLVPARQGAVRDRPRLLVTHFEGLQVGFPVDAVLGVESYHPSQLGPLPATLAASSRGHCSAVLSIDERSVGFLQPDLLFKSIQRCLS
tara:strand:- start:47522 stop:48193 length:672 start_codon:yes stop_codon:yes gene_type:complete